MGRIPMGEAGLERFELTLLTTYKRGHTPPSSASRRARHRVGGAAGRRPIRAIEQPDAAGLCTVLPARASMDQAAARRRASSSMSRTKSSRSPCATRPRRRPRHPTDRWTRRRQPRVTPGLRGEEGATPWWQKLRRLDTWRIRHDPLLRRTYESAACVVGVAPYVQEFLSDSHIRRFEIMSETAVHEVCDPIDRSGRSGTVRLLYVGRIIRTKGLRDIIRALDLVRDLDVTLDVVGDGNDREACEQLAAQLGVDGRVTFHGKLPRAEVDAFYERADIFVFPSYREPGGNVSLEAMAFSLPVIVCRRGGPGANVADSCAIRLEAESPAQLSADCAVAIRSLVEDPDLRHRMGAAAREHAATTHLWPQRLDGMTALYRLVIEGGR